MLCVLFFKKSLLKGKKKAQEEGGSLEYKDFFFFLFNLFELFGQDHLRDYKSIPASAQH